MKDRSDYKIGSPMFCAAMIIVLTLLLVMIGTSKVFGQELPREDAAVLYCEETTLEDSPERYKCYQKQSRSTAALMILIKHSMDTGTTWITVPIYAGCIEKNTNESGSVNFYDVFTCFGEAIDALDKEVKGQKAKLKFKYGI